MAKDYFQDIIPPEDEVPRPRQNPKARQVPLQQTPEEGEIHVEDSVSAPEKSIRNIDAPERRAKPMRPPVNNMRDPSNFGVQQLPPKPRRPRQPRRWLPWVIAVILIVALGALALFALRKTTVTVTPRSHTIVFDQTSQFTAYPAATAASGTLPYTVVASSLEASQQVQATGSQDVQTKAQGSITVYNDYSTSPVKLLATTRFETPNGLIFRVPDAVTVPGKTGSTPGSVTVTVFADQPGQQYNIGPVSRFTVPGLQSTPAMYSNVYAQSTASTTGGFSGEEPAVDPATLASTQAQLRAQLAQEAGQAASSQNGTSTVILPALMQISYQDLPQTSSASGTAQVGEQAQITMPVFATGDFTQALAAQVGEDTGGDPLSFVPGQSFTAIPVNEASSTLGTDPVMFSLSGTGTLVWQVDAQALAQALAGHDQSAFDTITAGFPGIQSANARIEPFWNTTFPTNPADINVVVESVTASQ